ncbi:CBS domain-containing protein [Halovibrio sp. HP20-50]|uniref:CBS domain-containing protein n=1 Tax=Halovibrio sp. HP20-59 TaxID=3080275 RepID=UPI00294AE1D2|nr:CBS domain-containing protein [Halovibrio sp. HP20-59]MEA2119119.1 CBS domain-containing protein [Halovibrio sp. HP20-59]
MTTRPQYLSDDVTIREVAQAMRENQTGFEPLANGNKVVGTLTDRDIAVRGVAEGKGPDDKASSIATENVLYTFQDTDVKDALQNMQEKNVQRLIVLNNPQDKDLVGVVTVGDVADKCHGEKEIAEMLVTASRHYG